MAQTIDASRRPRGGRGVAYPLGWVGGEREGLVKQTVAAMCANAVRYLAFLKTQLKEVRLRLESKCLTTYFPSRCR